MLRSLFVVFGALTFSACTANLDDVDTGSAVAEIAVVPPDVACVRVTVTGPSRSTDRFFNVNAGQSAVLTMNGLPTGQDSFLGQAYNGLCSNVTNATVPTWSSDPTVINLVPGTTANVSLKLSHNANANVSVDFVDDAGVTPDGGPFPSPGPVFDGGTNG
jgi:hypothetical protein